MESHNEVVQFVPQNASFRLAASSSHTKLLNHLISDYLGPRIDADYLQTKDHMDFWMLRLNHWPETVQYALKLLAYFVASVLSERVFSTIL